MHNVPGNLHADIDVKRTFNWAANSARYRILVGSGWELCFRQY